MIKVAIIGASGYTGCDAIEILLRHPQAEVAYLTALPEECGKCDEIFPQLKGRIELEIEPLDFDKLSEKADAVLCCLPHKVSMQFVPKLLKAGLKVVDFSADYRLKSVETYEKYYKVEHTDTANLQNAAYGLPELFRNDIKGKDLVANPGCFPTGAILAIAPLLKENIIENSVINNAVTGVSGGGKNPSAKFHFPNMNENIFPYGIENHRHSPEIEQTAAHLAGNDVEVLFQPHVGSFTRGILSSVYCQPQKTISNNQLLEMYNEFYKNEPFVQVLQNPPAVKPVAESNYCHVYPVNSKGRIIGFSAIDNLVKGASGQAVQNLNIIFDMEETLGLE
jgi:N-acetyl-gamma-glutamyl-phosphate reductase